MRRLQLCLVALLTVISCICPQWAKSTQVVKQATAAIIATTDTAVALGGTFNNVIIKTDSGASDMHVDLNDNAATTADFKIQGGGSLFYSGGSGISSFHYYATGAVGTYSYQAW